MLSCQRTGCVRQRGSRGGALLVVLEPTRRAQGTDEMADDRTRRVEFSMPHPVSIYLLAMACGDISCARIGACVAGGVTRAIIWHRPGPRSHVWAEPCVLGAAQAEFDGPTEQYLAAGAGIALCVLAR